MERYIAAQSHEFVLAIMLGIVLGIAYDVMFCLKKTRSARRGGLISGVLDLLFCAFSLAAFFLFMLALGQGELRGYIPAGMALGLAIYFLSLSDFMRAWLMPVISSIFFVIRWIKNVILALFSYPRGN